MPLFKISTHISHEFTNSAIRVGEACLQLHSCYFPQVLVRLPASQNLCRGHWRREEVSQTRWSLVCSPSAASGQGARRGRASMCRRTEKSRTAGRQEARCQNRAAPTLHLFLKPQPWLPGACSTAFPLSEMSWCL